MRTTPYEFPHLQVARNILSSHTLDVHELQNCCWDRICEKKRLTSDNRTRLRNQDAKSVPRNILLIPR